MTALGPRPIAPEQLEPLLAVINTVAEARARGIGPTDDSDAAALVTGRAQPRPWSRLAAAEHGQGPMTY